MNLGIKNLFTIAADAATLGAYSNLTDKPDAPPAPVLPPVVRMPTEGDAKKAKRLSLLAQQRRRGRDSTILTDNTDPLGA